MRMSHLSTDAPASNVSSFCVLHMFSIHVRKNISKPWLMYLEFGNTYFFLNAYISLNIECDKNSVFKDGGCLILIDFKLTLMNIIGRYDKLE